MRKNNLQQTLEILFKILVGVSLFMPVFFGGPVAQKFVFPFIVPKILYIRTAAVLLLSVYSVLLLGSVKKYSLVKTPINISIFVFLLSLTISTFVGVDPYKSFWDSHERMLGLFTLFHFIFYYYVLTSVLRKEEDWKWLLRSFLFVGMLVAFIGVLQKGNPDFLYNRGAYRVSATLGNAIYFSGLGLFTTYLGALLFWKEEHRYWKIYSAVGTLLGLLAIFLGGTRGTFLGLLAGIAFALFFYAFTSEKGSKTRKVTIGLIIAGVVLLSSIFFFKNTAFVKSIPLVNRLSSISLSGGTAKTRIMAWESGLRGYLDYPVFGWGPNNFFYAFNQYYQAEFLRFSWSETWFDNAHNVLVNTLTTQGTVGLLSYLGMFGVIFWALFFAYRRKSIDKHVAAIGIAFFLGHLVHNFFVFENPNSYLYFFFFLAFYNSILYPKMHEEKETFVFPSLFSCGLIVVIAFIVIYLTNIIPARANMASLQSLISINSGVDPIESYNRAIEIRSPHIDDIRHDFAKTLWTKSSDYFNAGRKDEAVKLMLLADKGLDENHILHPMDVRSYALHDQIYDRLYDATQDKQWLEKGKVMLERVLPYSPERQQLLYSLSYTLLRLGDIDGAIDALKKSIQDDPQVVEGQLRLASVYRQEEDFENLEKVLESIDKNVPQLRPTEASAVDKVRADVNEWKSQQASASEDTKTK
ncbi:MAG: hypothetical protein COV59_03780 [Candidatus Magasanikbacteria bacterium CG11_big_fil_rev_8_21_14_0_20_39_34]|uniref:O-antigen ligase-related domain-containing protein n=1 Tax=Candidatus Magasanikbacteria bacterium CG11_big_fil_rev_8_21_14_0_20_39_34 TaxID=1974653 RepID=A0A2H0N4E5_9BACT|nr:MAG: hypothetical protein COV59_03780 [Candidatus Magasanikbacteria bacterium CG11_big_fil_rev_8_21_14_0_20_39_34]